MSQPGWYPDPSGVGGQRYFDGYQWTSQSAPVAVQRQTVPIVQGPNHALHAILTLFTFPLCGGWAWVWLFVALNNRQKVRYL